MRRSLLAAACLAAAAAAPQPAKPRSPHAAAVRAAVRFAPPAGWIEDGHSNGPDPVLTLRSGPDRITLSLFGGEGSAYAAPEAFLRGPAASDRGAAPARAGETPVGGKKRALYEHGVSLPGGDVHVPSAGGPSLTTERFAILPLTDGRFVVAAHAYESAVPSLRREGEKAFLKLLASLKPVAPAKKKR